MARMHLTRGWSFKSVANGALPCLKRSWTVLSQVIVDSYVSPGVDSYVSMGVDSYVSPSVDTTVDTLSHGYTRSTGPATPGHHRFQP